MTAETEEFPHSDRLPLRRPPYDELTQKYIGNTAFTGLSPQNLRRSMAHHPKLGSRFQNLAQIVLFEADVPIRPKEIAIMRTTALTGAEYPWGMHVSIFGEQCGLDEAAINDLTLAESWESLTDPRWSDEDRLAIRMADELYANTNVTDETWALLTRTWPVEQVIELVFASGVYHLASYFTKTTAVPLEDGQARFPEGYRRK
ncbi:carboxymuconolactone decarboxylase family protein [Oceanicola sp. 22II-s10i]|uniref:carboxymuconolactone decarboxylase family protein n=1 Tax=Oceanicola sp. 22II-s10i TaxID=1317116 RepID=UPI000B521327|nr:hypothetical protein [Oceanicola sp. 22II-s10i]